MSSHHQTGLLISFDGTDCSGKETQARQLTEKLIDLGHQVIQIATPDYTTDTGRKLKALFQEQGESWNDLSWREQMELIAANRAEHKPEVVAVLNKGGVVIYDRYVPSSLAHIAVDALSAAEIEQRRQEIFDQVSQHEYETNGMPREDLSLFLDVPPTIAHQLLANRKITHNEENETTDAIALQERIYREYQWLISHQPDHYVRVNCLANGQLRSPEDIGHLVWHKVIAKFPQLANNK